MPLPDNLTLTYPMPPDASRDDTENVDPVVKETPVVTPAAEAALKVVTDREQFTSKGRKVVTHKAGGQNKILVATVTKSLMEMSSSSSVILHLSVIPVV